mgnify:CR=1 FL=1
MRWLSLLLLALLPAGRAALPAPVVWTDLAPESTTTVVNTMPLGNGVVAANAFVDNTTTPARPRLGLLLASQEYDMSNCITSCPLLMIRLPHKPGRGTKGAS